MVQQPRDGGGSAFERAFGARLEELVPGPLVEGAVGASPVEVVSVAWHGANSVTLTYTDSRGVPGQVVLGRDAEAGLQIRPSAVGPGRAFDGEAKSWRLAAEALRIR